MSRTAATARLGKNEVIKKLPHHGKSKENYGQRDQGL